MSFLKGTLAVLTIVLWSLTVVAQQSDLRVLKLGPDSADADSDVTFTIQVINGGPDDAATATLTDVIPTGLTFVSLNATTGAGIFNCSSPPVGSGGIITCTASPFTAGATVDFSLVLHVPAVTVPGTTFTNQATISSDTFDPTDENNSGSWSFTTSGGSLADMGATKSAQTNALPGSDVPFMIVITNSGSPAQNARFSDTLPGNMTFVSIQQTDGPSFDCSSAPSPGNGGTVTCTLATMNAGTSASFTLTGHIPTGSSGDYTNVVTATSDTPDPNGENNTGVATVRASSADVSIVKAGSGAATAGGNISWTLTISNAGPDTAFASLSDQLPSGTTFVSLVQNTGPLATCNVLTPGENGSVNCFITLANAESAQFTLTAMVAANVANGSVIDNTATASTEQGDPNTANNTSSFETTINTSADVNVAQADSPDPVNAGANLSYSIRVTNSGPSDAANLGLTDTLPPSTTFVSFAVPAGWTRTDLVPAGGTGTVSATGPALAAGSTVVFSLVVNVNVNTPNGQITNTATATSATSDSSPGNNSGDAVTTVVAQPDLTISKTHSGNFTAGQAGNYAITVSNVGGGTSSGTVIVTDTLPVGLTPTGPTGSVNGWSCAISGQTLTCSRTDALSGGAAYPVITLTVDVINPAPLSVTNTATVSGGSDVNAANNSASDPTTIDCSPNAPAGNTSPLVISRFRENGPNGPTDEFVEIYNPGMTDHIVASGNCTGGYSVVASAGNGTTSNAALQICQIPNGTVIPAGGYYLCTGSTYSLNSLGLNGGPIEPTAVGDAPIGCSGSCAGDIPNDAGLALLDVGSNAVVLCPKGAFGCPTGFNYSSTGGDGNAKVYDSVGFNAYGPNAPAPGRPSLTDNFCEGPCLQPVGDASTTPSCTNPGGLFPITALPPACYGQSGQYQILRRQTTFNALRGTIHQDVNSNVEDFILLAPNPSVNIGQQITGVLGVTSVLGAAGPQNSKAPADMPRPEFTQAPFDSGSQLGPRNAERNYSLDPTIMNPANDPLGTFMLRLRFTNNSGQPITPLRFRLDDLSTLCGPQSTAPAVGTGNARNLSTAPDCGGSGFSAILKLVNSSRETVIDGSGTAQIVLGTVIEDDLSGSASAAPGPLSPLGGGVDNSIIVGHQDAGGITGDGVSGGTGLFNVVVPEGPPENVLRIKIKFGVVKSGRFILLLTPQAKFGPTPAPVEGIRSGEKARR